ncbi:hypothetical protein, partial [Belliella pelovolcani]
QLVIFVVANLFHDARLRTKQKSENMGFIGRIPIFSSIKSQQVMVKGEPTLEQQAVVKATRCYFWLGWS